MTLNTMKLSLTIFTLCLLILSGCSRRAKVITLPQPAPPTPCRSESEQQESAVPASPRQDEELAETRKALVELKARHDELTAAIVALEERNEALEIELASTVEEVLRAKASTRGFHTRAFATLRIAEVRVQIESLSQTESDTDFTDRLRRAGELLTRADQALVEENFSGAVFLAERAGELTHQAGLIREYRVNVSNLLEKAVPIVPPRILEARVNCNLREGPSMEARIVGGLLEGQQVEAMARLGDWYQVETESGRMVWLHQRVVR